MDGNYISRLEYARGPSTFVIKATHQQTDRNIFAQRLVNSKRRSKVLLSLVELLEKCFETRAASGGGKGEDEHSGCDQVTSLDTVKSRLKFHVFRTRFALFCHKQFENETGKDKER